jgi:hypothetical protein
MTSRIRTRGAPYGLVSVTAALLIAAAAWWLRRRRAGSRIAAAEARMEPQPVVY